MVNWISWLITGIFILLSNIYVNNSSKTHCYKPYKKMTLLRAQINKQEL